MTYVIIVDPSMKYKVKKISSQLSYSIMKEIVKKKKLKIKMRFKPVPPRLCWLDATSN